MRSTSGTRTTPRGPPLDRTTCRATRRMWGLRYLLILTGEGGGREGGRGGREGREGGRGGEGGGEGEMRSGE